MWIDVVFSGGGVKAFAFVGALEILEKSGFRFRRTAGTSAGAIVAALLSAGYSSSEMKELMRSMDPEQFLDPQLHTRFPLYKWLRVYFKMGLYSGNSLENWMNRLLHAKGIRVFGDLPPGSLKVIAADVSKGRMVVLPDDLKDYGIRPEAFPVSRAVRMSAGLPFLFEPVKLYDGNGEKSLMVDGGILSNFPLWIFDGEGEVPKRPFLGMQTKDEVPMDKMPRKIKHAADLFRGLFTAMRDAHDEKAISKFKYSNIIFIPIKEVETKEFAITWRERERLFQLGADEAETFLKKWSY
ncbi:hypothetical protein EWH99_04030 [Sporolactobacillus sp. THM7-7]|nr:hypothetical protein EWH99_04030 [Sporolactobacillus sp. THM7-7]